MSTTTIQLKRGLSTNVSGLTLLAGEPAFTTDTGKLYIGDGTTNVLINPALGSAANVNIGTNAGDIPVLGADGKLADSVVPKIAITDTFVVANQTEMLALTAEVGDVAVRTDTNTSFILKATPASTIGNWVQLLTPQQAGVISVNGKTGAVTIGPSELFMSGYQQAATPGNITATDSVSEAIGKVEKTATTKAPLASPTFTGTVAAPTPATADNSTTVATTAFVKAQGYLTSAPVASVNGRTGSVSLIANDLYLNGYSKQTISAAVVPSDSISVAIGKLERRIDVLDAGLF